MATFLQKLDAFPPVRCRLVAVRYPLNKKYQWPVPLADEEIAERGNIGIGKVRDISLMTRWDNISLGDIRAFLFGCRLNFDNWASFARTKRLAGREKFVYLRRSPQWATQFEPLVHLWLYVARREQ